MATIHVAAAQADGNRSIDDMRAKMTSPAS
jgi:hypothetical protein